MNKWTEIRTAYRLAKLGTLSATANDLGIHRSTVMRHIDALEDSLQVKLFQRNDRGYIATEAGLEIMRLGQITEVQFTQFANRSKSREQVLQGTLSITCVNELSQLLFPSIMEYQTLYPSVSVDILGDTRQYDLEYGEADLALRTGKKPTTLDNIILPFTDIELTFCAHKKYIEQYGMPTKGNILNHQFVALSERLEHLPWNEWIYNNVPNKQIKITGSAQQVLNYALQSGCAIGVTTQHTVERNENLLGVDIGINWKVPVWILVHRDVIHIPKVRKFLDILKDKQIEGLELMI